MMQLMIGPTMGMNDTAIDMPWMIHCFRPASRLSQAFWMVVPVEIAELTIQIIATVPARQSYVSARTGFHRKCTTSGPDAS